MLHQKNPTYTSEAGFESEAPAKLRVYRSLPITSVDGVFDNSRRHDRKGTGYRILLRLNAESIDDSNSPVPNFSPPQANASTSNATTPFRQPSSINSPQEPKKSSPKPTTANPTSSGKNRHTR